MTLLEKILIRIAFPLGLLFCLGYANEAIRIAVMDYIPEILFPPFGLLAFFAFGACIGMLIGLLIVPEAVLNQEENLEEIESVLGVVGVRGIRSGAAAALAVFVLAAYLIYDKAFGV